MVNPARTVEFGPGHFHRWAERFVYAASGTVGCSPPSVDDSAAAGSSVTSAAVCSSSGSSAASAVVCSSGASSAAGASSSDEEGSSFASSASASATGSASSFASSSPDSSFASSSSASATCHDSIKSAGSESNILAAVGCHSWPLKRGVLGMPDGECMTAANAVVEHLQKFGILALNGYQKQRGGSVCVPHKRFQPEGAQRSRAPSGWLTIRGWINQANVSPGILICSTGGIVSLPANASMQSAHQNFLVFELKNQPSISAIAMRLPA